MKLPEESATGKPLNNVPASTFGYTPEERDRAAHKMLYPQLSADGWIAFKSVCVDKNVSYWCRQLHPRERIDGSTGELKLDVIVGIDAMVDLVIRTGDYEGPAGKTLYCGDDEVWTDTWNPAKGPPILARKGVYRKGFREAVFEDAAWLTYCPFVKMPDGTHEYDPVWNKQNFAQLGKCAFALALRRGFGSAVGGLYTPEEMKFLDNFQPKEPTDRPPTPPPPVDSDDQTGEYIDQEDFEALLAQAIPNVIQRPLAMSSYKIKYAGLWRAQHPRFYVMVAKDLRQMISQRGTGS